MKFDWDPKKATSNYEKHGVRFVDAITAFDDPYALIAPDPAHSTTTEVREWLIGESDKGVLVVIFTIRQSGNVHRLISARPANRKEKKKYGESKRVSI
jgi:uncharacterized protein